MPETDAVIKAAVYASRLASDQNMIKYQLDASNELEVFRLDLLGMEHDANGIPTASKFKIRKCNEAGADTILSFLRPRITKIVSLSNLTAEEISTRCHFYIDDLAFLLARHWQQFEIISLQMLNTIIEACDDLFFMTMRKASEAGERDTLRKQFTHVESNERIQDNRTGQKLPFPNPFGGG